MAQYMLAVRHCEQAVSAEEFRRLCADVPAFNATLRDAGAYVFHGGLRGGAQAATVVRQSGADFMISDGPYTETKEHLAGFWIINADHLDAALEWAKLAAVAHRQAVEVCPFEDRNIDELLAASAAGEL
ncbi:MAG TPA: YciI family protein [Streptosporangiaceae bacterium]